MSNFMNELGGMDAGFSQLYSSWKYDAASKASQWKSAQENKLDALLQKYKDIEDSEMDEAGAAQDEAGEDVDQENIYTSQEGVLAQEMKGEEDVEQGDVLSSRAYEDEEAGMENVERSYEGQQETAEGEEDRGIEIGIAAPFWKEAGDYIGKKGLKWGKKALSAGQDLLEKSGLKEAAEEKLGDLGDAAQDAAEEAIERTRNALREFRARQAGGFSGEGTGEGTQMEDLGGAGRGEQGAEFRQPQEYDNFNYNDDDPESQWTSQMEEAVERRGSAELDREELNRMYARNAARRAEQGGGEGEGKNWDDDLADAAEEVEPPSEAFPGTGRFAGQVGFDSEKAVPSGSYAPDEDIMGPEELRTASNDLPADARGWSDVHRQNNYNLDRAADETVDDDPEAFWTARPKGSLKFSHGTTEEPPDLPEPHPLEEPNITAERARRAAQQQEPDEFEEKAAEPEKPGLDDAVSQEASEREAKMQRILNRAADDAEMEEKEGEFSKAGGVAQEGELESGMDKEAFQADAEQAAKDQAAIVEDEAATEAAEGTADAAAEGVSAAVGEASTAEAAASTAIEDAAADEAADMAGDEAASGLGDFLDALGLSEDWNPIGWIATAAGVGIGIYEGVKGHHGSERAEHHAEEVADQAKAAEARARAYQDQAQQALAAAEATGVQARAKGALSQAAAAAAKLKSAAAAAQAAAASATARQAGAAARSAQNMKPPPPPKLDFAGKYISPVRTALAGL